MSFAIQYLESYHPAEHTPSSVSAHLKAAWECLPIAILITGWDLPQEIVAVCAEEAARHGAQHYRWQPLLSGNGNFSVQPAWQPLGGDGRSIAGFEGQPEFTFACPNHPEAQAAVLAHLEAVLAEGTYQGVFLDRIRYPSPAADPRHLLGCFCPHCQRCAAEEGVDLETVQNILSAEGPKAALRLARALLHEGNNSTLDKFLCFRQRNITRLVAQAAAVARRLKLAVGLDVFSPCLARMVGQDLRALDEISDWVKPMSYAHTLGPAGLPLELLDLADWLTANGVGESAALEALAQASGLLLPSRRITLLGSGLVPAALEAETCAARRAVKHPLLAGIALVEMAGINQFPVERLPDEVAAYRRGGADGLVVAWDLWRIPAERLGGLREAWQQPALPSVSYFSTQ